LHTFSLIYDHLILCTFIFICIVLIILFIYKGLGTYKFTFNEKEYTDGTSRSVNYVAAINRIINLYILILTKYWIYYFLVLLFFNNVRYDYLSERSIEINSGLGILKILILISYILKSIFILKIPIDRTTFRINREKLELRYIILNEKNRYLIVKPSYREKTIYYVVEKEMINGSDDSFEIINRSENWDEIVYHFDYLCNKRDNM
ncbi:hypothetical protein, partial [Staphylococcus muscae]